MTKILQWGGQTPSYIEAVDKGQCVDFTYHNTLVGSPKNVMEVEAFGHQVSVALGQYTDPDIFTVLPLPGWEAIPFNTVDVVEWSNAVITVCQMLMG